MSLEKILVISFYLAVVIVI